MVKELVHEYNSCDNTTDGVSLSVALDASVLGDQLEQASWHDKLTSLSCDRKHELIDAYLLLCRSKEELLMLEEDANSCFEVLRV